MDGKVQRVRRYVVLGTKRELPTKRLAERKMDSILARINGLDLLAVNNEVIHILPQPRSAREAARRALFAPSSVFSRPSSEPSSSPSNPTRHWQAATRSRLHLHRPFRLRALPKRAMV
jgi:hypothetical protein